MDTTRQSTPKVPQTLLRICVELYEFPAVRSCSSPQCSDGLEITKHPGQIHMLRWPPKTFLEVLLAKPGRTRGVGEHRGRARARAAARGTVCVEAFAMAVKEPGRLSRAACGLPKVCSAEESCLEVGCVSKQLVQVVGFGAPFGLAFRAVCSLG